MGEDNEGNQKNQEVMERYPRTHNIKKLLILPGLKGQGRDQGNHSLVRFGVVRD